MLEEYLRGIICNLSLTSWRKVVGIWNIYTCRDGLLCQQQARNKSETPPYKEMLRVSSSKEKRIFRAQTESRRFKLSCKQQQASC